MATSSVRVMEITTVLRASSPALVATSCKEAQLECASTTWAGREWSQPVHVSEYFTTSLEGLPEQWFSRKREFGKGAWGGTVTNSNALEIRNSASLSSCQFAFTPETSATSGCSVLGDNDGALKLAVCFSPDLCTKLYILELIHLLRQSTA